MPPLRSAAFETTEACHFDLAVVDGGKALRATDDRDAQCGLDVKFTRES